MANGHDGGVGGTRLRIFSAHYRAFKLQPLSRLRRQLPLHRGAIRRALAVMGAVQTRRAQTRRADGIRPCRCVAGGAERFP